jgi:hypothetical protein
MISHKHKCIFIHISKCAGSSVEKAFGIDLHDNTENNNPNLFGWNQKHKLFLQHATPQELFDYSFINKDIWDSYYKFIIVRNPYDRAMSDYFWMMKDLKIKDSFENFLNMSGQFDIMKNTKSISDYRADHLRKQIDYFYLNGNKIEYDNVIRFENISTGFQNLALQLNLPLYFFSRKENVLKKKQDHYSFFYNQKRKRLVEDKYLFDIDFLGYQFEDKRNFLAKFISFIYNIK